MKIKGIKKYENSLVLEFEEKDGAEILEKVLKYIRDFDLSYYYLIFGEYMGGYSLKPYKDKYSLLGLEEGVIKLSDEDAGNTELIYNTLNSYHTARLHINNDNDFISDLTNEAWRDLPSLKSGYSLEMLIEYITIRKTDDMPDWNIEKLNI